MISTQYTTEDLKKLPLRAIVAFAARWRGGSSPSPNSPRATRNKRPVAWPSTMPSGSPRRSPGARPAPPSIRRSGPSTRLGPSPASGSGVSARRRRSAAAARTAATVWLMLNPEESDREADRWTHTPEARNYRSHLGNVTAESSRWTPSRLRSRRRRARLWRRLHAGAIHDYETLLGLHLGTYPQAGRPIHPSPDGPLGPL